MVSRLRDGSFCQYITFRSRLGQKAEVLTLCLGETEPRMISDLSGRVRKQIPVSSTLLQSAQIEPSLFFQSSTTFSSTLTLSPHSLLKAILFLWRKWSSNPSLALKSAIYSSLAYITSLVLGSLALRWECCWTLLSKPLPYKLIRSFMWSWVKHMRCLWIIIIVISVQKALLSF